MAGGGGGTSGDCRADPGGERDAGGGADRAGAAAVGVLVHRYVGFVAERVACGPSSAAGLAVLVPGLWDEAAGVSRPLPGGRLMSRFVGVAAVAAALVVVPSAAAFRLPGLSHRPVVCLRSHGWRVRGTNRVGSAVPRLSAVQRLGHLHPVAGWRVAFGGVFPGLYETYDFELTVAQLRTLDVCTNTRRALSG